MRTLSQYIAKLMLSHRFVEQAFPLVCEIVHGWAGYADAEDLRTYISRVSARKRASLVGHFPSEEEIQLWPAERVRDIVIREFADEVLLAKAKIENDPSPFPDSQAVGVEDLAAAAPSDVQSIAQQLATLGPTEAMEVLTDATLMWAYRLDAAAIKSYAVEDERYQESWTRDDYINLVLYGLYIHVTGE